MKSGIRFKGAIGHRQELQELDVEFESGKTYVLTGRNGAGKSTLLKTLAGQIESFAGGGEIDGVELGTFDSLSKIKLIEGPLFLPDLTIQEHFELMEHSTGESVNEQIEWWQLEQLLQFPPSWLSSGQRQRVFLAIQMMSAASFLLFDEPERHLDSEWSKFLAEELLELADGGKGIIVATHDPILKGALGKEIRL